jgi:hypothetical protein
MTSSIRYPPNEHAPCCWRIFDELLRPPVEQYAYHYHQLLNDPGSGPRDPRSVTFLHWPNGSHSNQSRSPS